MSGERAGEMTGAPGSAVADEDPGDRAARALPSRSPAWGRRALAALAVFAAKVLRGHYEIFFIRS